MFRLFRRWRCTGLLRQVVRWTARNRETGNDRLAHRNHADGNDPGDQQLDPQRHGEVLLAPQNACPTSMFVRQKS